jgi:hypothetical protein
VALGFTVATLSRRSPPLPPRRRLVGRGRRPAPRAISLSLWLLPKTQAASSTEIGSRSVFWAKNWFKVSFLGKKNSGALIRLKRIYNF